MLRVLVVDDEPAARERLTRLLSAYPELRIAGEASDGIGAIELVRKEDPDAIFLDIEMPGCSGLEVAASLPSGRPRIVFCTAYDQYALDAFDVRAVDYLLKPVQRPRLEETVRRLIATAASPVQIPAPAQFLARDGERFVAVPTREIIAFTSSDGLTRLLAKQGYVLDITLNDLEARLPGTDWCRISRSALVHLTYVAEVQPMPGGGGDLVLRTGQKLEVSRRKMPLLLQRLNLL